jgi:hypothetical protein
MRRRQITILLVALFFCFCIYSLRRISPDRPPSIVDRPSTPASNRPTQPQSQWGDAPSVKGGPKPKDVSGTGSHPIWYLINDAQREFDDLKKRQSTTLAEAVKEYRRRYQMPPPPNFDKWFEFATSNGVKLVDEFDTINAPEQRRRSASTMP